MSAYGLLLARFAGADEVLFAATGTKKIPVAVTFSPDQNISDLIKNLRDQVAHSREVVKMSYEKIAETYNFPNSPEFISTQQENGDKTFALQVDENSCCVSIGFDGGKYSEPLIESFAAAYKQVIAQFLSKEKISDIDWLSADELAKVKNIHDTAWEVVERPAYRLLQDSAEKFPERGAAIANGKSLTYAELNTAANRLGHVLQDNGVGVEKIVGVMLNRGFEVYIARQGILKAGGAFLPMTPDYPDERVDFIVKDSNVRHIVTTRDIYEQRKEFFDALNIFVCLVEETQSDKISGDNLNVAVPYDALAYCIYTSGSTGKPKGVMLTQKNLVNFVDANPKNHEILGYTQRGKVSLALAAITFDVSIMEEFIPLAHGLTICMANEEEIYNLLMLKALCDKNQVDLMSCTPSYLANLIDFPEFEPVIKRLKSVDFGAKAFPSALFTKLRAANPDFYIMNGYGPTEATISCTMKAVESAENITIGFPNSNVKVVMTDEKNRPLPIGALGEMTILGDGVGRGYVNRDNLTKKNFIKLWNKPAYKSGDLARLLPNGEIAFHGRTDNQVKLRGLRVELGEIETVLNNFDGVKASIVVVKKNSAGDYLAGYFTAEKQINLDELKKHFAASDILTQINVEGVQNLINLCARKKARLIQISTVSIAGDNVDQKIPMGTKLAENDFYIGQNVTSNKYVYSKFQAEEIVLAAVGQGELDAKIMRVGNLMSRVSGGEFQINFMTNAFMRDEKKNLLVSNLIAYNESGNHIVEEIDHESFFTVKALYRLNCKWSITDDNYIRNAIRAIDTLGFFDAKGQA